MDEQKEMLKALMAAVEMLGARLEGFQSEVRNELREIRTEFHTLNQRFERLERDLKETHRRTLYLENKMYDELQ